MALRGHSWSWMLDHSLAKDVDALRSGGFDHLAVLPYFYNSKINVPSPDYGREVAAWAINSGEVPKDSVIRIDYQGETKYYRKTTVSQSVKKESKIIAINRGQNVRVMPYSDETARLMGIK